MFESRSLIFRGFWCLSVMDLWGITCDIFGRSVLSDDKYRDLYMGYAVES